MGSGTKSNGSYYTPTILSDFIIFHIFSKYKFGKSISVLEPSAGDGVFFDSMFDNQLFAGKFTLPEKMSIRVVEREEAAISKLRQKQLISKPNTVRYFNKDYLTYHSRNTQKFDLIIGNPPYIKSKYLTKEQIELCEQVHKKSGLSLKKIKNIWTSFLVGGVQSLNDDGVLCFVLPAELLQVIHAKELRNYLKDSFQKIEIFTFNELVFDNIEQDVIILICAKKQNPGVSFYHVDRLEDLKKPTYVPDHSNIHRKTLDKWTNYILSDEELRFLDRLRTELKLSSIRDYCSAVVGVVTAANDFFIVDAETMKDKSLGGVAKPMLQKGLYMASGANFTSKDLAVIRRSGKPTYFLDFKDEPASSFPKSYKEYLKLGEQQALHQRYKMKLRNNWHSVPAVWVSEGFFTKRSALFPRIYSNNAKALVTDSYYRITMHDGFDIGSLVFSFHNTLTFVFAELEGRYYGGSVLELMPNEFKDLPIPYMPQESQANINELDKRMRSNDSLGSILDFTDEKILKGCYDMGDSDLEKLRGIYYKLLKRRLKDHQFSI